MPGDLLVFRLYGPSNDGLVTPQAFDLSSADKASDVPRLSVWARVLTTPAQAHLIMGSKPKHNVIGFLPVSGIREIRPHPDDQAVHSLDVVWERAMTVGPDGQRVPDTRDGALGHSGIQYLHQVIEDAQKQGFRKYKKSLQRKLADLANSTPGTGPYPDGGNA